MKKMNLVTIVCFMIFGFYGYASSKKTHREPNQVSTDIGKSADKSDANEITCIGKVAGHDARLTLTAQSDFSKGFADLYIDGDVPHTGNVSLIKHKVGSVMVGADLMSKAKNKNHVTMDYSENENEYTHEMDITIDNGNYTTESKLTCVQIRIKH